MFARALGGFASGAEHLERGRIHCVYRREVERGVWSSIEEISKSVAEFFGGADFKRARDAQNVSGFVFSDVHGA